jgi:hydroxyethylthiazole kinase-like uncharacterized protein yjeF
MGSGMADEKNIHRILDYLIPHFPPSATLVLDGAAVVALQRGRSLLKPLEGRAIITPHAGEMASLLGVTREEVRANPAAIAQQCADAFQAIVALKGGETFIAHPTEPLLHYREGHVGLATSGSGDTLAGIVAGLAARGAAPLTAAAWGIWAHGSAGNKLAGRVGRVGFLARELLPEIPELVSG